MSFKKEEESSLISKRFVSESQLEEIKKKREEEWEIARSQGRNIAKEEEVPYDGRTLYDRLKEQKDKKQEEFEESIKFKNMIYKGLDKEDATFLSNVSHQQTQFHNKRFDEESEELLNYRAAVENMQEKLPAVQGTDQTLTTDGNQLSKKAPKNTTKPQSSLLAGVIIRKRSTNTEMNSRKYSKQAKTERPEEKATSVDKSSSAHEAEHIQQKEENSRNTALGGLIAYSDTDSSEDES